jgi:hypothetical protein
MQLWKESEEYIRCALGMSRYVIMTTGCHASGILGAVGDSLFLGWSARSFREVRAFSAIVDGTHVVDML